MKFVGIIPARYASTRFPGKPLAMLGGKPVIQRVYEQVKECFDDLYVATDDDRIKDAVLAFGGNVVMTSADCKNGTERCLDAYKRLALECDVIVNIQGDEPFIQHKQVEALISCFDSDATDIAIVIGQVKINGYGAYSLVLDSDFENMATTATIADNIVEYFFNGNLDTAINMQIKAIPLVNALFCEVNPIPVKAALNMRGYTMGKPRLPLLEMSDAGKETLKKALREFGL